MSEDDWRGIGINFWALYGSLSLLFGSHGFHGSMALNGFFNLKKPKIKSRESLLALTLQTTKTHKIGV
jgi:hypothetical protein